MVAASMETAKAAGLTHMVVLFLNMGLQVCSLKTLEGLFLFPLSGATLLISSCGFTAVKFKTKITAARIATPKNELPPFNVILIMAKRQTPSPPPMKMQALNFFS